MPIENLREFISELERRGLLLKVSEPVSPVLEVTEWARRAVRAHGPALFFERVEGSALPLAINLFGTADRVALALGVESIGELAARIEGLLQQKPPETLVEKLKMIPLLAQLSRFPPKKVRSGPCQEVIQQGEEVDLMALPALHCWPKDGGRYLTLTNVFTRDPKGSPNCGMYRIQIFDRRTCAMHWHIHHDGARHYRAWEELGERMPVAVAIGGDPAAVYSATAPLPPGVDEMFLAGFIRKKPVEMVACVTQPSLSVPAQAEIVLEGYIEPKERRREGPFGDHTGFYSLADDYPVFHLTALTHRQDPIYQTIAVGPPPMEDTFLGWATERLFLPFIRLLLPEIVDLHFPQFGVFHNALFVSIRKEYPHHARKVMHGLWGMGQLMFSKWIVVVDGEVDVGEVGDVLFEVGANCDFSRDLEVVQGPADVLDHAGRLPGAVGKMGMDATKKWPGEGFTRPWPERLVMDKAVQAEVERKLKALNLTGRFGG